MDKGARPDCLGLAKGCWSKPQGRALGSRTRLVFIDHPPERRAKVLRFPFTFLWEEGRNFDFLSLKIKKAGSCELAFLNSLNFEKISADRP